MLKCLCASRGAQVRKGRLIKNKFKKSEEITEEKIKKPALKKLKYKKDIDTDEDIDTETAIKQPKCNHKLEPRYASCKCGKFVWVLNPSYDKE